MSELIKHINISPFQTESIFEKAGENSLNPSPALYIFIFASWISALFWFHPRMVQLLNMADGLLEWSSLMFFIIFVELAWLYGIFNIGVVLFAGYYRIFEKPKSCNLSINPKNAPGVAILYTTYNDFVEKSAYSCVDQDYQNYKVYILDDSTDEEYKRTIDGFAKRYPEKVRVIRRADREGFKAGNLNNALKNYAREPFFAIADADEILPRNFLSRMIPEIIYDNNIGFVQANHRCNPDQQSKLAKALGIGIDIHWRWYQPLRNKFGFVMFLGHGAVLRRHSWEEIGGFPHIVSEDLGFAIRTREKGYRGKFVEHVVCFEDFPEDIRSFRVRHIKWTRGTCEFLAKESFGLINSKNITWQEKFDILFPTLNLPLTLFYFLFMINANVLLPLFFGKVQPVTMVLAGSEIAIPVFVLEEGFTAIFSLDFFLITMLTFFAPVLSFILDMGGKPLKLFRFLSHSTAVYAALSPLSAVGVLSFFFTGKATFLVTGDKKQPGMHVKKVGITTWQTIKNRFLNVLIKSHPDQGEVQLFEILTGVVFGIITLSMAQISFLGLSLAFVLFPLMHRLTWDNRLISKLVYLPFSIILIGLMIGAASAFGMQTVFFGYGFHF